MSTLTIFPPFGPAISAFRINTLGLFDLCLTADDGVRLWLGLQPLIASWQSGPQTRCVTVLLDFGYYPIQIEYFEATGTSSIRLEWRTPNNSQLAIIPRNVFYGGTVPPTPTQPPPANYPNLVPFSTQRLRQIAMNNPALIWGNNPPPTSPVTWNRDVGRFFQDAVLAQRGLAENFQLYTSVERNAALNVDKPVRPDSVFTIVVREYDPDNRLGYEDVPYPQSAFLEVKAVNGTISLSYENHQLRGLIDAVRTSQTAFGMSHNAGVVNYITTSNTLMSFDVRSHATARRVALCYAIVWEVVGNNPNDPAITVGPASFLNPEVALITSPTEFGGCDPFVGLPLLLSQADLPLEIPGDPDPPRLDD
jgi:hypothetical protein